MEASGARDCTARACKEPTHTCLIRVEEVLGLGTELEAATVAMLARSSKIHSHVSLASLGIVKLSVHKLHRKCHGEF